AAARAAGADGVELDVQRCASGEVVVFHDADLARLAGRPERIDRLTLAELRAVRLDRGERIPTLREALEATGPSLLVNVELKASPAVQPPPGLVAAALAAIADAGADERVLVSSFHPAALLAVRLRAPHLPTGYLFHGGQALPFRAA